jgi:superfamily II DNA or RNA helicase
LGERKRWGECFALAFDQTVARLMTSGTPFRSDRQRLPWVRYYRNQIDLSPPHAYSYGYGLTKWNSKYCALGDQVVRDVVIKQWNGVVDFTVKQQRDGQLISEQKFKHKLTDNIDEIYPDEFDSETGERTLDNRSLRKLIKRLRRKACIECGTEKHPYGTEYVRKILIAANDQLDEVRRSHEWAGGLIICDSIPHADSVAKALKKWTNEDAVVVHSESGDDKRALKNYKTNRTKNRPKWILAVGKISEGVDIKFLRVGVYLTTIQASLRWTQILGRILRTESELSHDMQTAYFYQYEDGIDLVEDENGNLSPESVNIKLFAESLMDEKAQFESVVDAENRDREPTDGGPRDAISITTETHSASGKETHHIYDGQRIEIKELEKFKILTAKTGWPPAKLKNFIEKCGEEELRRVL